MTREASHSAAPPIHFAPMGGGVHELSTALHLPGTPADVFPFFADAGNLARITPPELGFSIVTALPIAMEEGTLIDYRLRLFGVPFRWRTRISSWTPPHVFADEQLRGPYALWHHTHTFESVSGAGGPVTLMSDRVRFRLPLGPIGAPALPLVKLQLGRIFGYRARAIAELMRG